MRILLLTLALLIGLSGFSVAYAASCTYKNINGQWHRLSTGANWTFLEDGTVKCLGYCDTGGGVPTAYELVQTYSGGVDILIYYTKDGKEQYDCDRVANILQIEGTQFKKVGK